MRDFRFTDDQRAFQAAVRDYLAKECTADDVRTAAATGQHSAARWQGLAELGVVGLTVPEEHGGLGMTFLDLILLLEEAGYAALPEPLLEVTGVAAPLLAEASTDAGAEVLGRLAAGTARPVAVLDTWQAQAPNADAYLVWRDEALALAEQAELTTGDTTLDPTRPAATVHAQGTELSSGTAATAARARAEGRAVVGAAAMLVGTAARMVDTAVTYARQREQFGQPIGRFQAVKHHLADCVVRVEFARPAVYRAAWSVTHAPDDPDTAVHASMAKVLASEAAEHTAKAALQVHGAIGYTHEHDLHLWMQRAWSLTTSYGTVDDHRARLRSAILSH